LPSFRKRPLVPPKLALPSNPVEEAKTKFKKVVAEQMSELLIQKGCQNISDFDLQMFVYTVIQGTELDDGTLQEPRKEQPKPPAAPAANSSSLGNMLAAFGFTVRLFVFLTT
jgi:hypothetical protein